jgi:DNA repair photolyase
MFDANRQGSGVQEWAEHSVNIQIGCSNACIYCYAAHNANRFNQRPRAEWEREEFTKRAAMTSYPARDGVVMFPSSHDITPFNVQEYIRVAKLILGKGNKLLIVSKPRRDCIEKVVAALKEWRGQILFRFTIGTYDPDVSLLWEPGAPLPLERTKALALAMDSGYKTSVSIEPMLEGFDGTIQTFNAVRPFVTDTIWIGKMNKVRTRVDAKHSTWITAIEHLQRDSEIMRLYQFYQDNPIIRWKDSIKEVVARAL